MKGGTVYVQHPLSRTWVALNVDVPPRTWMYEHFHLWRDRFFSSREVFEEVLELA